MQKTTIAILTVAALTTVAVPAAERFHDPLGDHERPERIPMASMQASANSANTAVSSSYTFNTTIHADYQVTPLKVPESTQG